VLADAAPASGGVTTVTLITGILLAVAAIVSSLTPIVLARRKSRKEALAEAARAATTSSDLTLAGWTQLNAALQQEITRLQGVTERMQARIDLLEGEIGTLQKLALELQKGKPDA
jgi:hypothetical protein